MVAYGNALRRARRPGWEDAYLDYESTLRPILEDIQALCENSASSSPDECALQNGADNKTKTTMLIDSLDEKFLILLRKEIEKVSLFTLTRQGEIAEAVGALRFRDDAQNNNLEIRTSLSRVLVETKSEDSITESDSYGEDAALLPRGSITRGTLKTPKPLTTKHAAETRPLFRKDVMFTTTQNGNNTDNNTTDEYTTLGVELLHLLKFVSVNAMGVRKILKKHDKILLRARQLFPSKGDHNSDDDESEASERHQQRLVGGPEDHIGHLINSDSVSAIYSSLLAELVALEAAEMGGTVDVYEAIEEGAASNGLLVEQMKSFPVSLVRFKCTVSSIYILRKFAQTVNPFQTFLSSKAMILTGNDPGGFDRAEKALSLVLRFQPDSLLLMDEAALEDWERRVVSRTGEPEDEAGFGKLESDVETWGGINTASMMINLMSTLLYTVNYYIVAPTANSYAILLGTDGAFGATLIGASSFAAIFAAFLYSFLYTKSSFRSVLLFSALCPCVGNFLYSLALSYRSMSVAIWGRVLVGFGSAEVVNRQLISACVSFRRMTNACALFVAAGAVGMSIGPLLAAILDMVSGRDVKVDLELPFLPSGGIIYNHVTSPGFVMACLWFLEMVALIFFFREPERINGSSSEPTMKRDSALSSFSSETSLTKYGTGSVATSGGIRSAWSELVLVKDLIVSNMALPITLLLFGFIELVDEVLISSCSMVCRRYFSWHGSRAGFLIASLGSLVLPAHFVVEYASRRFSERRIMKLSIVFICISLFAILNYEGLLFDIMGVTAETVASSTKDIKSVNGTDTVDISIGGSSITKVLNKENEVPYNWGLGKFIYITFLSAVFIGTIILEGVDTSIMAKTTPKRLNDTFINSGLLATLVGTVGRVIGDSMITLSALLDQDVFTDFVNATFFPIIPLALLGLFLVKHYYNTLL